MANRLTKIYTRTGDKGTTGLADGSRISKSSARIQAIGDSDELNASLGVLISQLTTEDELIPILRNLQNDLFDLGAELAMPEYRAMKDELVSELENCLDQFNAQLPPLTDFILPGGNAAASFCHMSRTICRRAERSLVALASEEDVRPTLFQYLNRLSDLLFVLCRVLARRDDGEEVLWRSRSKPKT